MSEPTSDPQWADQVGAEITDPLAKKNLGWISSPPDVPPVGYVNWFWNLTYQWILYLKSATREQWLENWIPPQGGGEFKTTQAAIPAMSVEVDNGLAPQYFAWVNGKLTNAALPGVQTIPGFVAPATPGESQIHIVSMSDIGSLGVISGVAAPSPVAPAVPITVVALASVLIANGQLTILNADITDLRQAQPVTETSVVADSLTAASIAPKALGQTEMIDRNQSDLIKINPAVGVVVNGGLVNLGVSGSFHGFELFLLARTEDENDLVPAALLGSGFQVIAELYVQQVVAIGAHGNVVTRALVEPIAGSAVHKVMMSWKGGTLQSIPGSPSKQSPLLHFWMNATSGPTEGINISVETGLAFPGATYYIKFTPAGPVLNFGAPRWFQFTLPAIP